MGPSFPKTATLLQSHITPAGIRQKSNTTIIYPVISTNIYHSFSAPGTFQGIFVPAPAVLVPPGHIMGHFRAQTATFLSSGHVSGRFRARSHWFGASRARSGAFLCPKQHFRHLPGTFRGVFVPAPAVLVPPGLPGFRPPGLPGFRVSGHVSPGPCPGICREYSSLGVFPFP